MVSVVLWEQGKEKGTSGELWSVSPGCAGLAGRWAMLVWAFGTAGRLLPCCPLVSVFVTEAPDTGTVTQPYECGCVAIFLPALSGQSQTRGNRVVFIVCKVGLLVFKHQSL